MSSNKVDEVIQCFNACMKLLGKNAKRKFPALKRISMSKIIVIDYIFKMGCTTLTKLSNRTGFANSTICNIIDNLEKDGYVERIKDKNDRRSYIIHTTPKAVEKREEFFKFYEKAVESFLIEASDEDIDIILNGFKRFYSIIEKSYEGKK